MSNRTNNAIAAGSVAGAATAALSPGTLGVVCGTFSAAIPVIGQVLAVGTCAAALANAIPDSYPQAPVLSPDEHKLADLQLERIYLLEIGRSTARIDCKIDALKRQMIKRAHKTLGYA